MSATNPDALLGLLERHAGSNLQAAAEIDAGESELLYRRESLDERDVRAALAEVDADLSVGEKRSRALDQSIGDVRATLQLRRKGVLVVIENDDHRTLILLDRTAARSLDLFVRECATAMYDD